MGRERERERNDALTLCVVVWSIERGFEWNREGLSIILIRNLLLEHHRKKEHYKSREHFGPFCFVRLHELVIALKYEGSVKDMYVLYIYIYIHIHTYVWKRRALVLLTTYM